MNSRLALQTGLKALMSKKYDMTKNTADSQTECPQDQQLAMTKIKSELSVMSQRKNTSLHVPKRATLFYRIYCGYNISEPSLHGRQPGWLAG